MRPTRESARHNQQTYLVTSQTWGRRNLFAKEAWAKLFLKTLYHYRGSAYLLHEFVLMPDHFHLLITPLTSLERAVQHIKGGFSHQAKIELQSNIEIWQKGFFDHRIRDAQDYAHHLEYIQLNPVRKNLCARAEEYPYSSAHEGFQLDEAPQRLKPLGAAAGDGAAEAAPLQELNRGDERTEAAPLQQLNRGNKRAGAASLQELNRGDERTQAGLDRDRTGEQRKSA